MLFLVFSSVYWMNNAIQYFLIYKHCWINQRMDWTSKCSSFFRKMKEDRHNNKETKFKASFCEGIEYLQSLVSEWKPCLTWRKNANVHADGVGCILNITQRLLIAWKRRWRISSFLFGPVDGLVFAPAAIPDDESEKRKAQQQAAKSRGGNVDKPYFLLGIFNNGFGQPHRKDGHPRCKEQHWMFEQKQRWIKLNLLFLIHNTTKQLQNNKKRQTCNYAHHKELAWFATSPLHYW